MRNKIMDGMSLENIMNRLVCCRAVLCTIQEVSGISSISEEAVGGVCDLLEMICRDFKADIDAAEDYTE